MTIKKMTGTISRITDLSPSAREITLTLPEPLGFTPGAFVNVFVEKNGERLRRAYSISSDDSDQTHVAIAIRKVPGGAVGTLFWDQEFVQSPIELMGPLGLNTADKMTARKIFLFGFGIGAGVVKSIAASLLRRETLDELYILTGSKTQEEVLFKNDFTSFADDPRVTFISVVSRPETTHTGPSGYVQDHIGTFDFTDADVYMCGQEAACTALKETIEKNGGTSTRFFVEAFH